MLDTPDAQASRRTRGTLAVACTTRQGDHLRLEDGNHRVEGMRRAGVQDAWSIVAFERVDDRDRWIERAERL